MPLKMGKESPLIVAQPGGLWEDNAGMDGFGTMISHGSFRLKERSEFPKDYAATNQPISFIPAVIRLRCGIIRTAALWTSS